MTAKTPSKRASESRARRISNKGRQRVEAFIEPAAAAYLARVKAETGVSWSEQINSAIMQARSLDMPAGEELCDFLMEVELRHAEEAAQESKEMLVRAFR